MFINGFNHKIVVDRHQCPLRKYECTSPSSWGYVRQEQIQRTSVKPTQQTLTKCQFLLSDSKTNTMKQTAACGDGNTAGPGEDLLTFQGCWCQTISSKVLPSVDMKQITQKCPHCHMWQGKVLALRDVASSVSRTGTSKRRVTNPAGRILAEACHVVRVNRNDKRARIQHD